MDYIKQISTGKIIESGNNETSTMIQNAVNAGISEDDIEVGQTDFATMSKWLEEQDWAFKTYADKRKAEYDQLNQYEMMFDDKRDGTTTWVDKINEIKSRYPK